MLTRRLFLLSATMLPLGVRLAEARKAEVFATNSIANHGYDPVAYFTMSKPVDGMDAYSMEWKGATFRFSSAAHLAMFAADPEVYAPQYGGYCAYAMSKGAIATTVPEAWTIYEDRLYLNFSTGVRSIWQQDIPGNIQRANGFWPDILDN